MRLALALVLAVAGCMTYSNRHGHGFARCTGPSIASDFWQITGTVIAADLAWSLARGRCEGEGGARCGGEFALAALLGVFTPTAVWWRTERCRQQPAALTGWRALPVASGE